MAGNDARRWPRLYPPVVFLIGIAAMWGLRRLWPGLTHDWWPWNLAGIAPIAASLAGIVTAARQFGRIGTTVVPFRTPTALETRGLYRFTRNPIYLGLATALTGVAILMANLAAFAVIPLFVAWITLGFIIPEERALEQEFGETYRAYKARVRRWL
ncbi:MAG: isoprenylcysteine carboxylmethyltransferase family protein [Candidatus Sumerlaeaceae bacterium]|nr:isoprenylcysteine carboxylmethyltransferase family protein [Candidatus Sumerlaeaceae bacterium]